MIAAGLDMRRDASSLRFWRAQTRGWLLLAVTGFFIRWAVFGNAVPAFWLTVAMEPLAFALTSLAAIRYGRRRGDAVPAVLVFAFAVVCCALAAALLAAIGYGVQQLFPPGSIDITPQSQYRLAFLYYMGMFSIWTLAFFGVRAELDARSERMSKMDAETRALRLELEHLQLQVEPHFLFNALNTIVAEIAERPAVAEEMSRRLAAYLRYSLDSKGSGMCRLRDEVEAAAYYVGIQALRFEDQFDYQCRIEPDCLDAHVPHMMLQGLVENAVKHGMGCDRGRFVVVLRAHREGDELVIEVENPGRLDDPGRQARRSGGLANLRRRLALRYPGRNTFSLRQKDDAVIAQVRLRGSPDAL